MKALLLTPRQYSISETIEKIFTNSGLSCEFLDFRVLLKGFEQKLNAQIFRFPDNIRKKWEVYYLKKINQWYIEQFKKINPNIVFVYNNEMLLPETLIWLNQNNTKILFYLGDNPLYTHTSRYNLTILNHTDVIYVPDSFWQFQLKKIGFKNVVYLLPPLPEDNYYPLNTTSLDNKFKTEVFYTGMNYKDSWGYKKARFLSFFSTFDLKIIGNNAWKRWFQFYPELEKSFELQKHYIPIEELNARYNASKIIPVDGNPGIFNGIHLRAIEALAAGTLPLMEYNKDMDFIFDGVDNLPAVKDYHQIPEIASWYIKHDRERKEKVEEIKNIYQSKYNFETVTKILITNI